MPFDWNVFRYLGDICHTFSKCILMWQIHTNYSAEGVSLITQLLYLVVFCCRYLPFPLTIGIDPSGIHLLWNTTLKVFYILSSIYIILVMFRYARTRERENSWKLGAAIFFGSLVSSPFVMMIFRKRADGRWAVDENSWIFSIILESVCVLPQLLLLRQTSVPTVIDSFYLVTLGSYRFFYILNWIIRGAQHRGVDIISVIFGVIETVIFFDFFWVYWSRQRVKLRGGVVVDSDDLSKGWIVKRILGAKSRFAVEPDDEDYGGEEAGGVAPHGGTGNGATNGTPGRKGWGPRGISVSADDGVHDVFQEEDDAGGESGALAAPETFSDEPDHAAGEQGAVKASADPEVPPVGDGSEWRGHNGENGSKD